MLSQTAQSFNAAVAASPALQARLHAIQSPLELLTLAQEQGFALTGADLQAIAQTAYQQWLSGLNAQTRPFFEHAQADATTNQKLKQCETVAEAIALAAECGLELALTDLQQAAAVAANIPGFSFEKLWFRRLGLLPNP